MSNQDLTSIVKLCINEALDICDKFMFFRTEKRLKRVEQYFVENNSLNENLISELKFKVMYDIFDPCVLKGMNEKELNGYVPNDGSPEFEVCKMLEETCEKIFGEAEKRHAKSRKSNWTSDLNSDPSYPKFFCVGNHPLCANIYSRSAAV